MPIATFCQYGIILIQHAIQPKKTHNTTAIVSCYLQINESNFTPLSYGSIETGKSLLKDTEAQCPFHTDGRDAI